ncbi:hypothetical protein ACH5RR_037608 [Cinchona calisaya]|uniref:Uncharacterized protein n=1 Tax=Cinchona calisaya TaxID=153742 RepID=A0ABD2Y6P4_9GENT
MARIKPHDADDENPIKNSKNARKIKGIIRANTKPSYCLQRGIGNLHRDGESLRCRHRKKLRRLLVKLMRKHNWVEASGVLSVLLKGTAKELSISRNRRKYLATLELLQRIKGDKINKRTMQSVYELWMKKLGPMKKRPAKDKFATQGEYILFCLTHGNTDDAHQAALCLMQENGFESDAVSNLVVGLTFLQLWYSSTPKEMQLGELSERATSMQSEMSEGRISMSLENSEGHNAVESQATNDPLRYDSNTSIGNEKDYLEIDVDQNREVSMDVNDNMGAESRQQSYQADFYMHFSERSGHEESTSQFQGDGVPRTSIFYTHGLPPWLLPLQLPRSTENLENFIYMHRNSLNDHYKNALKYLRAALYSSLPAFEAFHPLMQMLLVGDQVDEALDEVERLSCNPDTALQLRLKTSLLEHFNSGSYAKLSKHVEDILKRDPTCCRSLARLVNMHQIGFYNTEKLVEMIAWHLDATLAEFNIWKEFASCFLKLSLSEGDQVSVCFDGDEDGKKKMCSYNVIKIPATFSNPESQYTWRLRCRWWEKRHYSQKILASEVAAGDLQLITYKAAAASHLYGREFRYVVKATEHLEREKNVDLLSFLRTHILNSVGFYFSIGKKSL